MVLEQRQQFCLACSGGIESTDAATAVGNTEDNQANVYRTNRISSSFSYVFGPADGLVPGQAYAVSS